MSQKYKLPRSLAQWLLHGLLLGIGLTLACAVQAQVPTQVPQALVLGTPRPDGNFAGVLLRRIHQEVFRRLGVPIEIKTLPTARLSLELSADHIDGDLARPWAFADGQANLIRVDESIMDVVLSLWTVNPKIVLHRLDQLTGSGLSVVFARGVVECEQSLLAVLPAHQVVSVTTTANALNLMHYGRNDVYCGLDIAILSDAGSAEFMGRAPPIKLLNIGAPVPLYLYLQRKHAALVPQITAILRKMKAAGVIEQLRKDALHEYKLASPLEGQRGTKK
jgi:polar amino acid transport system substrate-binding protein